MIKYDTIAIKKINASSDFTLANYDNSIIIESKLVFVNNPFNKYLKEVTILINKSSKRLYLKGTLLKYLIKLKINFPLCLAKQEIHV